MNPRRYLTIYAELWKNSVVIARYAALPYYRELENDLKAIDCELVNTYKQHRFIADLQNWTALLSNLSLVRVLGGG